MPYFILFARVLCVGLFAVALVSKVASRAHFEAFARSVGRLRGLRRSPAPALAAAVALTEAAVVGLVIYGPSSEAGLWLAGLLLAGFAGVIAQAVRRGTAQPCRCFGSSGTVLGWSHMWRDLVLASVAVTAAAGSPASLPPAPQAVVAAVLGALVVVVVLVLDDLVALLASSTTRPHEQL